MNQSLSSCASVQHFDAQRRFVRMTQMRPDGYVEFDFAVGDPELSVELILSVAAFREFCVAQKVDHLTAIHAETQAESPHG